MQDRSLVVGKMRRQEKSPPGVGKKTELLRLMDDHDRDRALTILYATESGGAQDAANKIARHCRNLSFECRNINVRDYPLVRALFLSHSIGRFPEEPGLSIRLRECAVEPRSRNSRNIRRFDDGLRTRTQVDDYALEYASSIRFTG